MAGLLEAAAAMLLMAGAQPVEGSGPPPVVGAVLSCKTLTDSAARLQCYDQAVAQFEAATTRGELLLVDRQQVRRTRQRLFGLTLPDINIFGGRERSEDQPRSITGEVAEASNDRGRSPWIVTLRDGAVWAQTDGTMLALEPRPGTPVVINRGLVGNYIMRIGRQPGIRVRRVR